MSVVVRSLGARVHRPALAQMVHELRKCETVQHALRRHPALPRHLDSQVRQVDFAGRVCIRFDAHHAPKLQRALMPAPIKVKTPGIGVDLHGHAMRGAGFENWRDILEAGPPQQLAAGHMAKDGGVGICYRAQDALGLGFRVKFEAAVYAGHHEVEALQHIVRIIQRTVGKNIQLDAFEDAKVLPVGLVQPVDGTVLLEDFVNRQAARVVRGFGMVGDAKILIPPLARRSKKITEI